MKIPRPAPNSAPMNALSPAAPHPSPVVTKTAPVNTAKPAVNPATTGMKIPRPAPNSAPMNALIPTAPHPSPAVMKTAPVNTAKPAASPATTGTQALKPAQSNAQPTTNTPAPVPVTSAAPVKPVTENTNPVIVQAVMNGIVHLKYALVNAWKTAHTLLVQSVLSAHRILVQKNTAKPVASTDIHGTSAHNLASAIVNWVISCIRI